MGGQPNLHRKAAENRSRAPMCGHEIANQADASSNLPLRDAAGGDWIGGLVFDGGGAYLGVRSVEGGRDGHDGLQSGDLMRMGKRGCLSVCDG